MALPSAARNRTGISPLPDLILVMTDQQRFDQIGYANGPALTPTLDRLARDGVIFDTAYSSSTNCVPARTSLMTGLLDHRADYAAPLALRPGSWRVPHALRAAGYQTALIGKMHADPIRADHGFDHLRTCEHLNAYTQDPADMGRLDHYHDWLRDQELADWRFETDDAMRAIYRYAPATHPTSWVRDEAIALLTQRDPNRPLFLVVSFPGPHPPINPPEPYASMYSPADVIIDPEGAAANRFLPSSFRQATEAAEHPERRVHPERLEQHRRTLARTYGAITQIDDAIGEVTSRLNLDHAILWFTSDHGDYATRRGLVRKVPWIPFDDLARVPCFATGGLVAGDRRDAAPMQSFDVATTCLSLAEVDMDFALLDGVDLSDYLGDLSAALDPERLVFSAISAGWPMVRHGPHKYIRSGWNQEVLFDLQRDPDETIDVRSLDPDRQILDPLAAAIDDQLAATKPPLATFDDRHP